MKFADYISGADLPSKRLETRSLYSITTDINDLVDTTMDNMTGVGLKGVPALIRATELIAHTVSSLPMEQVDEETGMIDPTPPILRQPNPAETYQDTLDKIAYDMIYDGNFYLWRNTPSSVYVVDPAEMHVVWDKKQLFPEYTWRKKSMRPRVDLIHGRRNPGDRLKGRSPITEARLMIQGANAEQTMHANLMKNNATPSGMFTMGEDMALEEADAFADQLREKGTGDRYGRLLVASHGATFSQVSLNPVDAQWIETRQFTVQEIGRLLGIPNLFLLVSGGDSLTYNTVESQNRLFTVNTLNVTYLEKIAAAFSTLLPDGKRVRFNTSELLRADTDARYRANNLAVGNPWKTVNEVRREEGLPPIEGGDELVTPGNFAQQVIMPEGAKKAGSETEASK